MYELYCVSMEAEASERGERSWMQLFNEGMQFERIVVSWYTLRQTCAVFEFHRDGGQGSSRETSEYAIKGRVKREIDT